jgi:F-type H+-transporting ATPase subunit delta
MPCPTKAVLWPEIFSKFQWLKKTLSERSIVATTDQTVSGVPGRYASALFDLANEQKLVVPTADGLGAFQRLIDSSPELQGLMRSPVYKTAEQEAAVAALASQAGIKGLALNFLKLMAKNRRLPAVPQAISAYHSLVAKSRGEVTADVTSAEALSAKQVSDLKAALKSAIGSDVALQTRVDPAILGGLIVKVGSRMMDNSLRTKLQNLKVAMKGNA